MARVLFISKPIAPPFHDGSKCLVRDVACNLDRHQAEVLTTADAPAIGGREGALVMHRIYSDAGAFTPALRQNLRAASWLATRAQADIWHYVFAPNPTTSQLGRALRWLRRKPVLQTVASAPREFSGVARLLFGDLVVAQSEHTARRIADAYDREQVPTSMRRPVHVIPPPVPCLREPSAEDQGSARRTLGIGPEKRILLFPGDLETGGGARRLANAAEPLLATVEGAVLVFAYRRKSDRADLVASQLRVELSHLPVKVCSDVRSMPALLATSSAVLFPVDDLWGKVDLPIVLLEAMQLGVPVLVLDHGPLAELEGAHRVRGTGVQDWVRATQDVVTEPETRASVILAQTQAVARCYAAEVVARRYSALYDSLGS